MNRLLLPGMPCQLMAELLQSSRIMPEKWVTISVGMYPKKRLIGKVGNNQSVGSTNVKLCLKIVVLVHEFTKYMGGSVCQK
jgi:hypothetical protein